MDGLMIFKKEKILYIICTQFLGLFDNIVSDNIMLSTDDM
jgi:hypothetical protein